MIDPGEEFRKFVEGRLLTQFSALYPDIPVKFENAPFQQPREGDPWAAFWIMAGTSFRKGIGARRFWEVTPGVIQFDIMVPEETGHATARKIVSAAGKIFQWGKFQVGAATNTHTVEFFGAEVKTLNGGKGFLRACVRVIYEHRLLTDSPTTP